MPHHPGAGATVRQDGRALPSRKAHPTVHGLGIGSVSQAGGNAKARRDVRA